MSEKMEGVVSGEIRNDVKLDRLAPLENQFLLDAQLANDWQETSAISDETERAGALLERINAERRALDASDAEKGYKDARDLKLSKLANQLRELI